MEQQIDLLIKCLIAGGITSIIISLIVLCLGIKLSRRDDKLADELMESLHIQQGDLTGGRDG